MSVQGMCIWREESPVATQVFQVDVTTGEAALDRDFAQLREKFNGLIQAGKTQKFVVTNNCEGSNAKVLLFVMVLIEDVGVPVSGVDPYIKRMYGSSVSSYLRHTGGGARALPKRKPSVSIEERRKELAGANK